MKEKEKRKKKKEKRKKYYIYLTRVVVNNTHAQGANVDIQIFTL